MNFKLKGLLKSILKAILDYLKRLLLDKVKNWGLWAIGIFFVVFVSACLLIWLFLNK